MVARVFSQFRARRHVGDRLQTDYEYVISGGQVLVGRIYPYHIDKGLQEAHEQPQEQDTAADLRIETYGNPDTLEWVPRLVPNLGEEEVDIETKEVGLNFRDVLVAMGMLDLPVSSLGVEAAGVVLHVGSKVKTLAPGDRVVTMGNNCFSTRLQQHADLVIKIPDSLGFQEAATMPGVYSTVVFALKHIARLEKNQV
jgi:NADPH:quinone reductase-like Zn-dependent oxidoreductase